MTTTTDLRNALTAATGFEDSGALGRAAAVRGRITRIRRRRRTAALAAVVVVVAAAATAVVVPSRHGDVDPATVVGVHVPETATIPPTTGFAYRITNVQSGDAGAGSLTVRVPAGADLAVAMVASGLGDGTATLVDENNTGLDRILGTQTGGAGIGAFVPAAGGMTLTLKAEGATPKVHLALVTYALVEPLTVGVRDASDQTAFREQVGGRTLQVAQFMKPGQAQLTVPTHGEPRSLFYSVYCVVPSSAGDVWMNAEVDGRPSMWGKCDTTPRSDASGDGFTPGVSGPASGSVRVWTSHGEGGSPAAIEGAVVGVGVYDNDETSTQGGITVDRTVESQGRVWRLISRVWKDGNPAVWHHTLNAAQTPRLLRFAIGNGGGTTRTVVKGDDGTVGQSPAFGGGGTGGDVVLLPGTTYTVTVHSDHPVKSQILVYDEVPSTG